MVAGGISGRSGAVGALLVALAVLAGCQSDNAADALDLAPRNAGEPPVRASELRAFCPPVQLREGTASYATYERGGQDNPARLVHQASISDVTRSCTYSGNTTTVNVAVAGRIVPGPKGKAGSIAMPIRVVALLGGEVAYSKLHQHVVPVGDTIGATQFIFSDSGITVPSDTANVVIYAGYDEGPPRRR